MTRAEWPSLLRRFFFTLPLAGRVTGNGMLRFILTRAEPRGSDLHRDHAACVRADPPDPGRSRSRRWRASAASIRSGTSNCARNTASTSRCWCNTAYYLSRLVHGDLGRSIVTHEPVISEFAHAVPGDRSSLRSAPSCSRSASGCRPASSRRSGATPSSITA